MARSAKQLAFFKSVVDAAGLCGKQGGKDVFDYEIRMARAVRAARSMRDRLRRTRATRHQDAWARKQGFKSYAELLASNWQPYATANAWRKKVKASQRSTKPTKTKAGYKKRGDNPFRKYQPEGTL